MRISYLLQNKQARVVRGCFNLRLFGGLEGRASFSSDDIALAASMNLKIGEDDVNVSVFREATGGRRRGLTGRKNGESSGERRWRVRLGPAG